MSENTFNYIKTYYNSIPNILCDEIINLFEKSNTKYEGITLGGLNKDINDTTDLNIPTNDDVWLNINKYLNDEISRRLQDYINDVKNVLICRNFHIFDKYLIQKYTKNVGKYIEHTDDSYSEKYNSNRYITFIWYLNDVNKGGETLFWGDYKITPKKGKLVLFPSLWCFPHKGNIPLSNDKYIITGWLYLNC
jgi:hypothetical protein